jgi:hypothetical protein
MKTTKAVAVVAFSIFLLAPHAKGQQSRQTLSRSVRELYSDNATIRADAARKLVAAGPTSIPMLLPVLCDASKPNFDVAWRTAATVAGQLKAVAAAPCLIQTLGLGDVTLSVFKPEKTIAEYEPGFAALIQIGEPAVPAIARALPSLHPDKAYLALRVLRVINTPAAKAAAEDYLKVLQNETRIAKEVLDDFQYGPGLTR